MKVLTSKPNAPKLLVVAVPGDQEVQAQVLQGLVEALLVAAGEVGHRNLPVPLALGQDPGDPLLLLRPQGREPARAGVHRTRALRGGAGGARPVVRSAAHVVVGILLRRLRIHKVGVQEVVVHAEAKVRIDHGGGVVRGRHHPTVAGPGVGHLLVPGVVKLEATPVMVPQNAEPGLVAEPRALVDAFEDLVELVLGGVGDLVHGEATGLLDASPVEVVSHVQDVPGLRKTW